MRRRPSNNPLSSVRRDRPGLFTGAIAVTVLAALMLTVVAAGAAGSRARVSSGPARQSPPLVDDETASRAGRHVVAGALSLVGPAEQTSSAGRWRVQGRIVPANNSSNTEADECETSVRTTLEMADVSGDGQIDVDDLIIVLAGWGGCATPGDQSLIQPCAGDIDGDRIISCEDLVALLRCWQQPS